MYQSGLFTHSVFYTLITSTISLCFLPLINQQTLKEPSYIVRVYRRRSRSRVDQKPDRNTAVTVVLTLTRSRTHDNGVVFCVFRVEKKRKMISKVLMQILLGGGGEEADGVVLENESCVELLECEDGDWIIVNIPGLRHEAITHNDQQEELFISGLMKTMTKKVCGQPLFLQLRRDDDETTLTSLNANCDFINMRYC